MIKILIADDEPIERQVISKKITRFFPDQFEICLAENGIEALKTYEREHCPICLLDISMPGMTGLEVAEAIREDSSDVSIIFLTAFDEFSFAKKAIEVKALDYILKPGADEDLQNALEEAISIAEEAEHRDSDPSPKPDGPEGYGDEIPERPGISHLRQGPISMSITKRIFPYRMWPDIWAIPMCISARCSNRISERASSYI